MDIVIAITIMLLAIRSSWKSEQEEKEQQEKQEQERERKKYLDSLVPKHESIWEKDPEDIIELIRYQYRISKREKEPPTDTAVLSYELVVKLFNKHNNVRIHIINETKKSDEQELFEDLMQVIHGFSMKMYSKRRFAKKLMGEDNEISKS